VISISSISSCDSDSQVWVPDNVARIYRLNGVLWQTTQPPRYSLGVCIVNSCPIDSFLTSIKIMLERKKYNFVELFKWGPGTRGSTIERSISDMYGFYKQAKTTILTVENDRFIKTIWVNIAGVSPSYGIVDLTGTEPSRVFDVIPELARFQMFFKCGCTRPFRNRKGVTLNIHVEIQTESTFMEVRSLADWRQYAVGGKPECAFIRTNRKCTTCGQDRVISGLQFPTTTWILRFEAYEVNYDYRQLPLKLVMGGVTFKKAYSSFRLAFPGQVFSHLRSVHFLKKMSYKYDDSIQNGELVPYSDNQCLVPNHFLQRTIFYRESPIRQARAEDYVW